MDEVTSRFFNVIKALGLKQNDVVNVIPSLSKQKLSNAKSGRNVIQTDIIQMFCEKYSNVNLNYMFTGKGDPYIGMRIKRGKSEERKFLSESEILKIRNLSLNNESLEKARDLFVFQCYTGLAYSDLYKFDFKNSVVQHGENMVIRDIRVKTSEPYFVVLLQPALDVLKRYSFVLPSFNNHFYNMELKVIGQLAKLSMPLTSHMGRHSFAVLALSRGMRIENVSRAMGHTNIKTTQIYAKILSEDVEADFEKMK